jgi:hypothetical protein
MYNGKYINVAVMSATKLTGTENVTTYACGPTDMENQVKIYKKYRFMYINP